MIQLRKVSPYVYDVFNGNGFDDWTRVRKYHWGLSCIGGIRLERRALRALQAVIQQYPHGNVDAINMEVAPVNS